MYTVLMPGAMTWHNVYFVSLKYEHFPFVFVMLVMLVGQLKARRLQ